jgi:predicted aspartyl protease
LTHIDGVVRAPRPRGRGRRVRFLVDSGAVYSVLRREHWRALRLTPDRELDFVLADGTSLTRGVSECLFEIEGRRATSPVVLGETEDEALLGAVTLETLGLVLNPFSRTLQPMRMVLAASGRRSRRDALKGLHAATHRVVHMTNTYRL